MKPCLRQASQVPCDETLSVVDRHYRQGQASSGYPLTPVMELTFSSGSGGSSQKNTPSYIALGRLIFVPRYLGATDKSRGLTPDWVAQQASTRLPKYSQRVAVPPKLQANVRRLQNRKFRCSRHSEDRRTLTHRSISAAHLLFHVP